MLQALAFVVHAARRLDLAVEGLVGVLRPDGPPRAEYRPFPHAVCTAPGTAAASSIHREEML